MRRWIPLFVYLGLAVGAAAVALAGVGGQPQARAETIAAAGAFEISNSQDGLPIFGAAGIAPGDSTSGTVEIADPGSEPVALVLRRGGLVDTPGLGGGALSSRLQMTITDVTEPASPLAVYAGPLASMPAQAAGRLEAGETRTFEFTATLPDSGAPAIQNEVQGASTAVAYAWTAAEASAGEEEGPGGEDGDGPGGEPPAGGGSGAGDGSSTEGGAAPRYEAPGTVPGGEAGKPGLDLTLSRVRRTVGARGRVVLWAGCDETCRIGVRGRLRGVAGARHRGARVRLVGRSAYRDGSQRLRIRVPLGLRRWLAAEPGRKRLRVELVLRARDLQGERDAVRRTLRLRLRVPPPR
jgi:hypothetical protein